MLTLKLRIIMIILPTDRPTDRNTFLDFLCNKNLSCLRLTIQEEFPPVKYHLCRVNHKIQFFSHIVEFTMEQVLTFPGRKNSIEPPVLGLSNSLPYGLKESREL